MVLHEQSQPLYLEGYHRPDYRSPDDAVYDAIADLMSDGRTSRLYRSLVRDKKIASDSAGFTGLPGNKYPHLFAFYAFPMPGHTTQEVADAIHDEIEKLKTEDISDAELKMIKTRAKANLLRSLANNEGLGVRVGAISDALWRLAGIVPLGRSHRQSHQGGHPPRGQRNFRRHQPHRRHHRNRRAFQTS